MTSAPAFVQNLALVLCVAAVTTVLCQRLRQPVVFGYLLAGLIVGPHIPIPLIADEGMIHTLSELGVILLLFSLGLDFSLRRLWQVGPTAGAVAIAQSSAMMWLGYLLGQAFGWTVLESVYAGAIIAISSTTIIAKAFEEQNVRGKVTDIVLGVLVFEDLIGIFLIAILTTLSAGSSVSTRGLLATGLGLTTFLGSLMALGLLVVPRATRYLVRTGRRETIVVALVGWCFAAALLAQSFGYSVALGAFLAGSLVAESGEVHAIEELVRPVRDMFAAVFFIAVGMLIDPVLIMRHAAAVLAFTAVVLAGKVVFVTASSFLTGYSPRIAVQAGMSLAQIGEFSFIIAAVGLNTGATREFLYTIAVAVSAITTVTTPLLIRQATPVAAWVDRRLPHAIQTFAALYGSWIERLRRTPNRADRSRSRRLVQVLVLDTALMIALIIGIALASGRLEALLTARTPVSEEASHWIVVLGGALLAAPLVYGLVRTAKQLGVEFALKALPDREAATVDFAGAPRRAFIVTIQLSLVAAAGVIVLGVTQPFVPALRLAPVLLALMALLSIAFWRRATDLQGHVRAGAEIIALALSRQMTDRTEDRTADVRSALPGLGEPVLVEIRSDSPAAGQTLAALNLRALTGATVLTILRQPEPVAVPYGHDEIRVKDVLAIAGTDDAIAGARSMLEREDPSLRDS